MFFKLFFKSFEFSSGIFSLVFVEVSFIQPSFDLLDPCGQLADFSVRIRIIFLDMLHCLLLRRVVLKLFLFLLFWINGSEVVLFSIESEPVSI
jgi:hypothetical protein